MSTSAVHFARATSLLLQATEELHKAAVAQKAEGNAISESGRSLAIARTNAETAVLWSNQAAVQNIGP